MTDRPDRKALKRRALRILKRHTGSADPIRMLDLHARITGEWIRPSNAHSQCRITRSVIRSLRQDGHPVCFKSGTGGGYFWAQDDTELDQFCTTLHKRVISVASTLRDMKRMTANQLVQQLELDLNLTEEEIANG